MLSYYYLLIWINIIIVITEGFLNIRTSTKLVSRNELHTSSDTGNVPSSSNNNNNNQQQQQQQRQQRKNKKSPPQVITLAELRDEMIRNPSKFIKSTTIEDNKKKPKKYKRTRKVVENPQQQYVYASHKRTLLLQQQQEKRTKNKTNEDNTSDEEVDVAEQTPNGEENNNMKYSTDLLLEAKVMGLIPSKQHCDPLMVIQNPSNNNDNNYYPKIVGQIRVCDNNQNNNDSNSSTSSSGSFAYLIEKPMGWSILGSSTNVKKNLQQQQKQNKQQQDDDDSDDSDSEVISSDYNNDQKQEKKSNDKLLVLVDEEKYQQQIKYFDEDDGTVDVIEYNELDVLALLTPEELEEYIIDEGMDDNERNDLIRLLQQYKKKTSGTTANDDSNNDNDSDEKNKNVIVKPVHDPTKDLTTAANIQRIEARVNSQMLSSKTTSGSSFADISRPSVISWLKEYKASQGTPIRGGNFWTPITGATNVDDSGLVLICPKINSNNLFCDSTEYIAVVGTGGYLAPPSSYATTSTTAKDGKKRSKVVSSIKQEHEKERETPIKIDIVSKLVKGRAEDCIHTVKVIIPDTQSTCTDVIEHCQQHLKDGIRGDPFANPFDRRAQRRLIHCNAITVSSLVADESIQYEMNQLPDDIAVLAERKSNLKFHHGSFLGRSISLRSNQLTNAYREMNGAADGFPGWTVDRYGQWLFVTHDPQTPRGPLPSIHDGNTAGVYYVESIPDRSSMSTNTDQRQIKPKLLEGKAAPEVFPVLENGVTYLVSLNKDMSTGIFLDQRLHRAWLKRNCCAETRVLNCFAHTGAFSVAAASAGASTVSIDLSKKWLERLPEQLKANGIEFNELHDCIHGDCFEWLARLAKRGEKFDIVILDPPSSSVGGRKKKRWSIKNDMDELVALASVLVKKGGLLWTTTNSASIHPVKFAKLCRKGLIDAGIENATLERIQPMPSDFPSIGSQPVKNLVWRLS